MQFYSLQSSSPPGLRTPLADVVMINSSHVWQGPDFEGTKSEQFALFEEVGDYMTSPYPAWTAVGTTGLPGTNGFVEVQLIARVPGGSR